MEIHRIAFAAVLLAGSTIASSSRADDREVYVNDVLARNPSLGAGALRRDAFGDDAAAATRWPDPFVAVEVDQIPQATGGLMPMVRYQLTQVLPWPGKLSLARDALLREKDASGAELDVRKLDLRVAALRGWAMLYTTTKEREVTVSSRNVAATIVSAALGRYGTGIGNHHELVRAQVEVSTLDVAIINLEGKRASIVAMLNGLRNLPPGTAIADPTVAHLPPRGLALAQLTDRAIIQRPELRGLRALQDGATTMARLSRREPYPDLMTSAWFNQMIGAPPTMGFMVGFTIPIFGASRGSLRGSAFDARAAAASRDQEAARAMIRSEVADALVKVETARRTLDLLETVVLPKARESFDSSLAGYGASTTDVLGLLDARRSLQNTEIARADAQAMLETAVAELERAIGGPLEAP
jgi:outer membrane protein TolC